MVSQQHVQQQQHRRRDPDLILRPYEEGVNFTLKLIDANPLAKVVEVDCRCGSGASASNDGNKLSSKRIGTIFRAIGGSNGNNEEDYDDEGNGGDDDDVDAYYGDGLRCMESLTVIGDNDKNGSSSSWSRYNDSSSSFLRPLTSLLVSTGQQQQQQRQTNSSYFRRLCLIGVNLEGSVLDFRAMVECLRIHPHVQYVQVSDCSFTNEEQRHMKLLEEVFSSENDQRQYQPQKKERVLVLQQQSSSTSNLGEKKNWFERMMQSCLCWG